MYGAPNERWPKMPIFEELSETVAKNLKTAIIDFNQMFQEETDVLRRLAAELGADAPKNIERNRDSIIFNTERAVLLPIAEACVSAILRELLQIAQHRFEPFHVPLERFRDFILRDAIQSERFKRAIGFNYEIATDYEKVKTAITVASDVFLNTDLLKTAAELEVNENMYEIYLHQNRDGFYVRQIAEH
jgi:hypothetical protein